MQIVIDIPDEEYEDVKKAGGCYYDFGKAIYYGIPLPKGHGDLIDRGQALNECYNITIDGDVFKVVQYETLLGVPTIIEADKAYDLDNLDSMLEDLWNDYDKELEHLWNEYGIDKMTNGDVIKRLFPDAICIQEDTFVYIYKNKKKFELKVYLTKVSKKWWNAPYEAEEVEK